MKKAIHWLDEYLEEFLMVVFLIAMTLIMGIRCFPDIFWEYHFHGRKRSQDICLSGRHFLGVSLCNKEMHIN